MAGGPDLKESECETSQRVAASSPNSDSENPRVPLLVQDLLSEGEAVKPPLKKISPTKVPGPHKPLHLGAGSESEGEGENHDLRDNELDEHNISESLRGFTRALVSSTSRQKETETLFSTNPDPLIDSQSSPLTKTSSDPKMTLKKPKPVKRKPHTPTEQRTHKQESITQAPGTVQKAIVREPIAPEYQTL